MNPNARSVAYEELGKLMDDRAKAAAFRGDERARQVVRLMDELRSIPKQSLLYAEPPPMAPGLAPDTSRQYWERVADQVLQGDSMSTPTFRDCSDPACPMCHPLRRADNANSTIDPAINDAIADAFKRTLDRMVASMPTKPSTGGTMTNDTQAVISDLRRLAESGEDLKPISKEINALEEKNKDAIVEGLRGMASLAMRGKSKGHRFTLFYWKYNEAKSVEGVNYAYGEYIPENKEREEVRVLLQDSPFGMRHCTMTGLEKLLKDGNTPYHIAYFDAK